MLVLRKLRSGDEAAVERFLATRPHSSLILLANLRRVGLEYRGEPFQATWVASFASDRVVAVAAHAWNDNLVLQAPSALDETVRGAVAASGRPIRGLLGKWAQVVAAEAALALEGRPAQMRSPDVLFALELAELRVPADLAAGTLRARRAEPRDSELLVRWRMAYHLELLGAVPGAALERTCREEVDLLVRLGDGFLLFRGEVPLSFSGFNARIRECAQVGGVFTPPELRGRGYARAAVAASLLAVRDEGATRSSLFTGATNHAAQRAYLSLGYRRVGDYGLILYAATD